MKPLPLFFAIANGEMDAEELKKDSSNGLTLVLMLVLVFFLILFPFIQFRKMKKGHLASKPLDFVQGVLLANRYGIRGKICLTILPIRKGLLQLTIILIIRLKE